MSQVLTYLFGRQKNDSSDASEQNLQSQHLPRSPASDPNGITGRVCNWVDAIQLQDVPPKIQAQVKTLILDGIGCLLVGAKLPWSRTAVEAILDVEGGGDCSLFGWNKSLSPLNAALLNGTFIQGFELDDVHVDAPWHANSIILPALFAAAEHRGRDRKYRPSKIDGSNFLLSTIVGFELGSRVGRALHGSEMLSRGWHSGAVFGPPAAAAAVCKLLQLPPSIIEDAIGTACTQSCGLMSAQYESMVKRMQHGFAARNGLFAALMSQRGYTGIDQVLERPYGGFLSTYGQGSSYEPPYLEGELVQGLGKDWRGIGGIRVKSYGSMIATHAPIDCIKTMQQKDPVRFAQLWLIKRITVEQAKAAYTHGGQKVKKPITSTGAQMSTRYIVAVQLLDREVLVDQFREENLNRDSVWWLESKVECIWNPQFDEKGDWHTRVSITFLDGVIVVEEIAVSEDIGSLLSEEKIKEKWRLLAGKVLNKDALERIEDAIMGLEKVEDIGDVARLLETELKGVLD